ncbi:hypothetical protein FB45DRAFT_887278 [Roridomyces roridus]|uniref:SHSP domain-containing protein n=1 Tax=Roridomyces roridus TaxID=1738132 RepID=A0AAD7CJG6_9AGAR|nr:hypothetical protein FB45DRAFT_887278 [Roridomyces roridus]
MASPNPPPRLAAVSRRHVSSPITPVTTAGVTGLRYPISGESSTDGSTRPSAARQRPRMSRLESSSSSSKLGLVEISSSTPPELDDAEALDNLWDTLFKKKEIKMNQERSKVKSLEGQHPAVEDVRMRSPSPRPPSRAKISDPPPVPSVPSGRTPPERRSLLEDVLSSDRASPLQTPSSGPQLLKNKKSITTFRTSPEKNYVVAIFDLRGVDKEDIRVTFRRDHIMVSWEKWEVETWEEEDCIARQTVERVYHRVVPLAEGTAFRDIHATFKGVDLLLRYPLVGPSGMRARGV